MRLFYLALSQATYGETLIGLSLADQLRAPGVSAHFVIPESARASVEGQGFGCTTLDESVGPRVRGLLGDIVKEQRPDGIILSDYFTYWSQLEKRFGTDPWFIHEFGVPVLPIDIWELQQSSFRIDVCGGPGQEIDPHIRRMPAHLRPVPVAHTADTGVPGFPYRVIEPESRPSDEERGRVRAELGLAASDRLVMFPVSEWQQPPRGKRGMVTDMVHRLAEGVPELIVRYLRSLPDSTHVLVVGEPLAAFSEFPAERLHVLPRVPGERYHALLASSDLIVSLSMAAMTVIRSLFLDVPALMISNSFTVRDEADAHAADRALGGLTPAVAEWLASYGPIEPFRQWPKGAFAFQAPLWRDNGYASAIAQAELLDEKGVTTLMERLLHDPEEQRERARARAEYVASVNALPPALTVVRRALATAQATPVEIDM